MSVSAQMEELIKQLMQQIPIMPTMPIMAGMERLSPVPLLEYGLGELARR